jgi:hypothetical protein
MAKQNATKIATPGLNEVRTRTLTALDGQYPADSSGYLVLERNVGTAESTNQRQRCLLLARRTSRRLGGGLTGSASRKRVQLAQT